jgi:hypothetical protein
MYCIEYCLEVFMFAPCITSIKALFIIPTDAHNYKIVGMLKQLKFQQLLRRFGSRRNHHQGAISCLAKTTITILLCSSLMTWSMLWRHISLLCKRAAWISQVVSFPQVSPSKTCIRLSFLPYALHAPPIPFFSILSPEKYWVSSTDHSVLIMKLPPLPYYLILRINPSQRQVSGTFERGNEPSGSIKCGEFFDYLITS